uniref:Uncharacterized protein n=1 Tax=Sphaerodactylus townsendi TaxID=933632 RepID=A0ACB8G905_9SAUR
MAMLLLLQQLSGQAEGKAAERSNLGPASDYQSNDGQSRSTTWPGYCEASFSRYLAFRGLDKSTGSFQYLPSQVCQIFLACGNSHNMGLSHNIPVPLSEAQELVDEEVEFVLLVQMPILQIPVRLRPSRNRLSNSSGQPHVG